MFVGGFCDSNVAFFSHSNNLLDSRNCPYDEANFILEAGVRNYNLNPSRGVLTYKDNPNIIEKQMQKYESKGFPKNNGLITGMVIL